MSIIIDKFCEGKELIPIVLLIVAEDVKVLFEDLINAFSLTVRLRVEGC